MGKLFWVTHQNMKLKSQVLAAMKAQCAALLVEVGGYCASKAAPMMKATAHARLPPICRGRLPTRSMRKKKMNWANSPSIELIP